MLHYYMHDGPAAFRFELAGELEADDAARLEQDWRTAASMMKGRTLVVDLSFVTAMGEAGQILLRRWHADGAQFAARSPQSRKMVETITGRPFAERETQSPTYEPWLPHGLSHGLTHGLRSLPMAVPLLALLSLLGPAALYGAELKPATLNAWDQYVQSADAGMQDRLRADHRFLWTDEAPERTRQLRAGQILVTAMSEHSPRKVPAGLIHHWLGAAFIPNTRVEDVLGVVRDYGHYKDYYNPTVIESRTIRHEAGADRFSVLLMNQALFLKVALENECESSYVQAGAHRWYSIANTVRVQEIEDYGQESEHRVRADEGSGYIWRLHSISRFEERDGGVYIEIEAMALSREIPAAVRWVVDPIVRRVSKGSLMTSLRQTQGAVSGSSQVAERPAAMPRLAPDRPVSGFMQSWLQH